MRLSLRNNLYDNDGDDDDGCDESKGVHVDLTCFCASLLEWYYSNKGILK